MGLQNLVNKARGLVKGRKDQLDKGLDKAEEIVSEKTGGKYDEKVKEARRKADEALTGEEPSSTASPDEDATRNEPPETGGKPSQG